MEDFRHERHGIFEAGCAFGLRHEIPPQGLDAAALDWLDRHARQVFAKMDCKLLASDGEADHLHILVEYPPKLSVSVLVNAFKGTSSRVLRSAGYRQALSQRRPVVAGLLRGIGWRCAAGNHQAVC